MKTAAIFSIRKSQSSKFQLRLSEDDKWERVVLFELWSNLLLEWDEYEII